MEELLAGEQLYLDVTRMELAFADLNRREYEMTKHVSLRQLDPRALIELRTTGQCTIDFDEAAFDLDAPGHYFRRLRGAALTIPCVAGPYTSVNCTLTLLSSSVRTSPSLEGGYDRTSAGDSRFSDYYGGVQSIVTSSASNDSGLFSDGHPPTAPLTLTLREEHYPYWASLATDRVLHSVELFASAGSGDVTVTTPRLTTPLVRGTRRCCGPTRASAACATECSALRYRPRSAS